MSKKILLDDLGILVLKTIYDNFKAGEDTSPFEIAKLFASKKFNKPIDKIYSLKRWEVRSIYKNIMFRIKSYISLGFVIESIEGESKIYNVDFDKICFSRHKFSDGYHECIIIRI